MSNLRDIVEAYDDKFPDIEDKISVHHIALTLSDAQKRQAIEQYLITVLLDVRCEKAMIDQYKGDGKHWSLNWRDRHIGSSRECSTCIQERQSRQDRREF